MLRLQPAHVSITCAGHVSLTCIAACRQEVVPAAWLESRSGFLVLQLIIMEHQHQSNSKRNGQSAQLCGSSAEQVVMGVAPKCAEYLTQLQ